jgi:hypothetical protein
LLTFKSNKNFKGESYVEQIESLQVRILRWGNLHVWLPGGQSQAADRLQLRRRVQVWREMQLQDFVMSGLGPEEKRSCTIIPTS